MRGPRRAGARPGGVPKALHPRVGCGNRVSELGSACAGLGGAAGGVGISQAGAAPPLPQPVTPLPQVPGRRAPAVEEEDAVLRSPRPAPSRGCGSAGGGAGGSRHTLATRRAPTAPEPGTPSPGRSRRAPRALRESARPRRRAPPPAAQRPSVPPGGRGGGVCSHPRDHMPAAAPPPAPGPQPRGGPEGVGPPAGRGVCIREFRAAEQEAARRIFYDGILERIPNTAFRGLRQHPRTQLLYALLAALCFAVTRSLMLTCLVPAGLLALRYYYSRKVILAYLECALHTDMADIEQYYMKPPGSCFWVAVLDGNVVGIVAARAHEEDNTVELLRMSVDSRFRGKGIAKALGRKVLEFAVLHNYSAVVLGTTAVKVAAHKLYESLGFRHMGASDHYVLPGMTLSLAERLFFQVRYHRYRLQLREE
nr:N-acetylaspartate synthetase [Marmota flaviventris]